MIHNTVYTPDKIIISAWSFHIFLPISMYVRRKRRVDFDRVAIVTKTLKTVKKDDFKTASYFFVKKVLFETKEKCHLNITQYTKSIWHKYQIKKEIFNCFGILFNLIFLIAILSPFWYHFL